MKNKILITGVKFIGVAAIMLAACSTRDDWVIIGAIGALLFLAGTRKEPIRLINNLMLTGAGLGWVISLSANHLADVIKHQGIGFEMWRESDNGVLIILFCVGIWFWVADYAKQFIPPNGNSKN